MNSFKHTRKVESTMHNPLNPNLLCVFQKKCSVCNIGKDKEIALIILGHESMCYMFDTRLNHTNKVSSWPWPLITTWRKGKTTSSNDAHDVTVFLRAHWHARVTLWFDFIVLLDLRSHVKCLKHAGKRNLSWRKRNRSLRSPIKEKKSRPRA
jgi:hypothetical protein